jgi:hypothetical protein
MGRKENSSGDSKATTKYLGTRGAFLNWGVALIVSASLTSSLSWAGGTPDPSEQPEGNTTIEEPGLRPDQVSDPLDSDSDSIVGVGAEGGGAMVRAIAEAGPSWSKLTLATREVVASLALDRTTRQYLLVGAAATAAGTALLATLTRAASLRAAKVSALSRAASLGKAARAATFVGAAMLAWDSVLLGETTSEDDNRPSNLFTTAALSGCLSSSSGFQNSDMYRSAPADVQEAASAYCYNAAKIVIASVNAHGGGVERGSVTVLR